MFKQLLCFAFPPCTVSHYQKKRKGQLLVFMHQKYMPTITIKSAVKFTHYTSTNNKNNPIFVA